MWECERAYLLSALLTVSPSVRLPVSLSECDPLERLICEIFSHSCGQGEACARHTNLQVLSDLNTCLLVSLNDNVFASLVLKENDNRLVKLKALGVIAIQKWPLFARILLFRVKVKDIAKIE